MFKVKEEYKPYDQRRDEVIEYILAHGGLKKPAKRKYVEPETDDLDFDDDLWHAREELSERRADARRLQQMVTPDMALYDETKMDEGFGKYCRAVARFMKKNYIHSYAQAIAHIPPMVVHPRRLVRSPETFFSACSGERADESKPSSTEHSSVRVIASVRPTFESQPSFFSQALSGRRNSDGQASQKKRRMKEPGQEQEQERMSPVPK
jgi:hypothetical protein